MSLKSLKGNTYVIEAATNVGIYVEDERVYVIDPGTLRRAFRFIRDEFAGKQVVVLNTHHHADHTLLDYMYEKKLGAEVYTSEVETHLLQHPELEGYYLFGAETPALFKKTFFLATPANALPFPENLPLKPLHLPGHTPGHHALLTPDGVIFSGDLYFAKEIVDKYGYPYHFSVSFLKESVEKFKSMDFEIAVPAHGKPSDDPTDDIDHMMKRIQEFEGKLFEILRQPHSVEEAAFKLAEHFSLEFPNGFFYLFRSFVSSLIQDMEKELQEDGGRWKRI